MPDFYFSIMTDEEVRTLLESYSQYLPGLPLIQVPLLTSHGSRNGGRQTELLPMVGQVVHAQGHLTERASGAEI